MSTRQLNREEWLTEISEQLIVDLFLPVTDIRDSMRLKLSVGFPPGCKPDTSVIGVCFASIASDDGFNEIFINPRISDSMAVLEVLVHELVHAIDDCQSGHKGEFSRIARAVGLEGKMTATNANPELRDKLRVYIDQYGDIPHAAINYNARKRQTNRQKKVWCGCGFVFRTSASQINNCIELTGGICCPQCTEFMQYESV